MFDRCLYFNLNALVRKVNKIWVDAFAEYDLSPAHAYLLRLVAASPGLRQTEISHELKLEKSTITRFIDVMVERGFLRRKKEGREQLIYPSQKTLQIVDSLNKTGSKLYKEMSQTLGSSELKSVVGDLRDMSNKLA